MKNTTYIMALAFLLLTFGCNKEEAVTPSADFTTNLQDNSLKRGQPFTIYLSNVQGEFAVYFKGNDLRNTYDANDPTRLGTPFSTSLDSLVIPAYNLTGEKVFTIVASSSGNWAKDYIQDIKSITINVVD